MQKGLRTLSGLVDFECAARWGSFRLAAAELHKTPAAVSQQVKQLEQALGFTLFLRHPRQVELTAKGHELAATVSHVLGELRARVVALQEGGKAAVLRVSATHSFAMKWLVPRLHRFSVQYPELDLQIEASDRPVSLEPGRCDLAIRYGRIDAVAPADLLWREHFVLACAPELARTLAAEGVPPLSALLGLPLLYEETPQRWLQWLQANHLPIRPYNFARNCSHAGLLVQAAVAGMGVALVPYSLACEDIAQGRLLLCPSVPLVSDHGYRLLSVAGAPSPKVAAFRAWLHDEAVTTQAVKQTA